MKVGEVMPRYVYKGLNTGQYFEFTQSFTEAAFETHPETGEPLVRVIQPAGVVFKGSGWYVKDSGRSAGSGSSSSDSNTAAEAVSAPAGSSDE